MSPEAAKVLEVFRVRGLRSGAVIHPADFGNAVIWESGFVRDEAVRQALAELFGGGYLVEHEAAFELTDKGEQHIYRRRRGQRQDLDVGLLSELLRGEQARRDLRRYFGVGLGSMKLPPFTGGRFEALGGGGDRPEVRNQFTAADLLAVGLLSVQVPPPVALDLLEGALGQQAADYLRLIPADVPLWSDDAASLVEKGGPADSLWQLLDDQEGVGWVTAGKLLARKRPSLIPVYDHVVRCAVGRPEDFWTALRNALRHDDGRLLADVTELIHAAELPPAVTPLRALDVTVWMHHRPSHTGSDCAGLT
jgi:hypothetical protein